MVASSRVSECEKTGRRTIEENIRGESLIGWIAKNSHLLTYSVYDGTVTSRDGEVRFEDGGAVGSQD